MAQSPQVVNPKSVEGYIRPIIEAYLLAVYSQDISLLPARKMREEILSSTAEGIAEDRKLCQRTCSLAKTVSLRASDYDRTKIFSFRGIEFSCLYSVRGSFNGKLTGKKKKTVIVVVALFAVVYFLYFLKTASNTGIAVLPYKTWLFDGVEWNNVEDVLTYSNR